MFSGQAYAMTTPRCDAPFIIRRSTQLNGFIYCDCGVDDCGRLRAHWDVRQRGRVLGTRPRSSEVEHSAGNTSGKPPACPTAVLTESTPSALRLPLLDSWTEVNFPSEVGYWLTVEPLIVVCNLRNMCDNLASDARSFNTSFDFGTSIAPSMIA